MVVMRLALDEYPTPAAAAAVLADAFTTPVERAASGARGLGSRLGGALSRAGQAAGSEEATVLGGLLQGLRPEEVTLQRVLEAIPAEVAAVLTVKEGGALDLTAYRHRDPSVRGYSRVSEYLSREVLHSREAVLAENVARDRYLRNRESLHDLGITSVICAPVSFADRVKFP